MIKKVNVLGTEYKIHFDINSNKEPRLKNAWGITDFYTKEIFIDKDIFKEQQDTSTLNLKAFRNKVLRHEIVHAFLYESGMAENSNSQRAWSENEEMVDWFAVQSPKLYKIYKDLDIL